MTASDHLGPQFYHGTDDTQLNVGDYIKSAHSLGLTNHISGGAMGSTRNTYFTDDPQTAFDYAADAHDRNRGDQEYDPSKPSVYTVQPVGRYTPDNVHGENAYKSRARLRVTGVHSRGVDAFYDRKYND